MAMDFLWSKLLYQQNGTVKFVLKNVFLCTKTKYMYAVLLLIPSGVYYGWLTLNAVTRG